MKKFFALIIAALFFVTAPAYAETQEIDYSDTKAKSLNDSVEEFYATLPEAKGNYKNSQRPILIEGAMNVETNILIHALKNPVTYRDSKYLFVAGTYKNYPVVVVRTEQGIANAAASTALAIKKFNPVAVINQGTAGGHDSALKIGDIVIGAQSIELTAVKTAYSNEGAGIDVTQQEMRGTYSYDEATKIFQPLKEYHADTTLFNIAFAVANEHENFNVISGTIGTTDRWLNCVDYINFLHEKYGSSCEEMETNAAAQICHTAGIPFIGIRVISNSALTGETYSPESATVAQDFVLLVVEDYIRKILKK